MQTIVKLRENKMDNRASLTNPQNFLKSFPLVCSILIMPEIKNKRTKKSVKEDFAAKIPV